MPDADILIHSGDVAKAWTRHRRGHGCSSQCFRNGHEVMGTMPFGATLHDLSFLQDITKRVGTEECRVCKPSNANVRKRKPGCRPCFRWAQRASWAISTTGLAALSDSSPQLMIVMSISIAVVTTRR